MPERDGHPPDLTFTPRLVLLFVVTAARIPSYARSIRIHS
jgi:hypothetical protein